MIKSVHLIFDNLKKSHMQERLTFFYWKPSLGRENMTAIIYPEIPLPDDKELNLMGNVSYKLDYFLRVISNIPDNCGVGLVHNHFTDGWQGLSYDDRVLESEELTRIILPKTKLPFVGLTMGTDGFVSGRFWFRDKNKSILIEAEKVRIVDKNFDVYINPHHLKKQSFNNRKVATRNVWGDDIQTKLENLKIGIIGLGSVGSIIADGLSHIGVRRYTLIDPDIIEIRNLDRTQGATYKDAKKGRKKVSVASRGIKKSCTSQKPEIKEIEEYIQNDDIYKDLLDCDFIFSCVDKHYPRYILNFIALSHLIPVIDGGILVELRKDKSAKNIVWREHLVAPNRICMCCMNAFSYDEVLQEREGTNHEPAYIKIDGEKSSKSNDNVYSFSLNLASNEINLFLGYLASKKNILEYKKNRQYHPLSGNIFLDLYGDKCTDDCLYYHFTSTAHDIKDVLK